jgi:lipoprotein-anchoring transpeptidase ErfK/SrfK
MRQLAISLSALFAACSAPANAAELTLQAVNSASFSEWDESAAADRPDPFIIRVQVLLDRDRISPGVIDGIRGENLKKAVRTFEERKDLEPDGEIDERFWAVLQQDEAPVLKTYKISDADQDERYVEAIPEDYAEMAKMEWLGYRGPGEMLAERYHMDEDLLETLNPQADFTKAGAEIVVAAPDRGGEGKVSRIVIDRDGGRLLAYATGDELVAAYPASIGSPENPTPSGTHEVKVVVPDPTYTYDPDKNFQQDDNTEPLELPAGPNGPVGLVWIDLSEPTYGIHGTPDPALVSKASSHGCVRLTNWDAQDLARLVEPGTTVEFQ